MSSRHYALLILLAAFLPLPVHAADSLLEGAKLCTRFLPRYEREYGIPEHFLSAIASTESGRYHEGLQIKVPWPWTINAEGKGYIFDTKEEAIAAVKKLRRQGIQSIDVGCMQVNLHHHPQAFTSLEEAFEPQANVAYAASFLHDLYEEKGSWRLAAADYHSRTPRLGNYYAGQVFDNWYQIIGRLRAAHLQVASTTQLANADDTAPDLIHAAVAPKLIKAKAAPRKLAYKAPRMNSVQVSQRSHDNGVIIVRPEIRMTEETPVITVAQAHSPAADTGVKVIRVDAVTPAPAADARKTGPNFIFND